MITLHIPAHSGSDRNQDYCWAYDGHWDRTVEAVNRRSIRPGGLCVFSESGDEYVDRLGCVVQEITEEQYQALPARLRRRLDTVRA